MVEQQLRRRGIAHERVLAAMAEVPREEFVPEAVREFAYSDSPLPIEEEQTISQPYIVAAMAEELELEPDDRVLEIGAGSGYAAAVLSRAAGEVFAIERHAALAELATERCRRLGYDNVTIRHGDGTKGWPEKAPFDAVVVAAGGPDVPRSLREQLAVGGRLVMPVGADRRTQRLVRVRRVSEDEYETEPLGEVRFVPLIGEEGWAEAESTPGGRAIRPEPRLDDAVALVREHSRAFEDLETVDLGPLLERIGDARFVLLGEASHGTSEFYRFRARLTRELIERAGFNVLALEADWPDAARLDGYVRGVEPPRHDEPAFSRFPTWMWRNEEFRELVDWLRDHDRSVADAERQVSVHGLDVYSLYTSIGAVLRYLDDVDPEAARVARVRYGCLMPWEHEPALYGRAALTNAHRRCEADVVAMLVDLLKNRLEYERGDGARFFDAAQNARVIAAAERYYRVMYEGPVASWNLRDQHMTDTLESVMRFRGPEAKAIVWAHNSHLGDARATEMGARGEHDVGQLLRQAHGDAVHSVGFGTDRGTVAAASDWGAEMQVMDVRPAHADSYEAIGRATEHPNLLLPLRHGQADASVRAALEPARLERAIGVIYRPQTELQSHYFYASLPHQFDEWVFLAETSAVTPLPTEEMEGVPETYPFGL